MAYMNLLISFFALGAVTYSSEYYGHMGRKDHKSYEIYLLTY